MTPESIFPFCNQLAMAGWLLLAVAPRWRWSARLITAVVIPVLFAALYLTLFLGQIGRMEGGFGSLQGVATLFENPHVLLAGWVHYLAFDLFIGSWEVREASRLGIHHLVVLPCLALTFFYGPTGLLLFLVLRAALRRKVLVGADDA